VSGDGWLVCVTKSVSFHFSSIVSILCVCVCECVCVFLLLQFRFSFGNGARLHTTRTYVCVYFCFEKLAVFVLFYFPPWSMWNYSCAIFFLLCVCVQVTTGFGAIASGDRPCRRGL
jgi:hypothetical protein